ncbi:MAG: heavy-metal-associated domain-containing protein [Paracoccaceae bacterium]
MTTLSIPDMTCGHCRASVESALTALPGAGEVTVDLPNRQASVSGPVPPQAILAALDEIGFPAEVVNSL